MPIKRISGGLDMRPSRRFMAVLLNVAGVIRHIASRLDVGKTQGWTGRTSLKLVLYTCASILPFTYHSANAMHQMCGIVEVASCDDSGCVVTGNVTCSWVNDPSDLFSPIDVGGGTPGPPGGPADGGGSPSDQTVGKLAQEEKKPKGCDDVTNHPVVIATGNKIKAEVDFLVPPNIKPLGIARFYDESLSSPGIFGNKWSSNIEYSLQLNYSGVYCIGSLKATPVCDVAGRTLTQIVALRTSGYGWFFTKGTDGIWRTTGGDTVVPSTGGWTLTTKDGDIETYNGVGQPLTIRDARNVGLTYSYNPSGQLTTLTHSSGRTMQLAWSGQRVSGVTAPDGKSYSYAYTGLNGYLSSVTYPDGLGSRTYHYEDSALLGALTGISVNGVRYSRYAYFPDGRVLESGLEGGIEKSTFSYGTTYTDVTNALGQSARYQVADLNGSKVVIGVDRTATGICPAASTDTAYDARGNVDYEYDGAGTKTDYTFNLDDRLTQKIAGIRPAGDTSQQQITQLVWDTTIKSRLLAIKVFGNSLSVPISETWYDYFPSGDARAGLLSSIRVINKMTLGVQGQEHRIDFAYTVAANGMVLQQVIDGPLQGAGDAVTYTYATTGDLIEVKNSLNQATIYSNYTPLGQVGRISGPNGEITDYVYDARGRMTAKKHWFNGAWQNSNYSYDGLDHVTGLRTPDGQWKVRQYDPTGRLTTEYAPEAGGTYAQTRYTYNNVSLPTRIDTERVSGVTLAAPPVAPVNLTTAPTLTAPATNATGSYTVSWTAVAGATGYVLEESVGAGGWAQIQNAAATSKALSGKGNGTYNYRVTACNSGGCGPVSAVDSTVVSVPAPSAPTLTGPATYQTVRNYTVTWSSVAGATSYQLEESTIGGAWSQVYNGAGTSMAFSAKPDGDYGYQVRACNAYGCGAYSTVRTITVEKDACPTCFMGPAPAEEASLTTDDNGGAA